MWVELAIFISISELLLELWLLYRQYKHVERSKSPPEIYKADITDEDFKKSKEYELAVLKFSLTTLAIISLPSILDILIIRKAWEFTNYGNEIVHSLIIAVVAELLSMVVSLPISYYRKFVIEEKFGFNNSTVKLFITDILKELLVDVVLYAILIPILILLYRFTGRMFAIYALIFFFVFTILMQVIFPILILPLFTKFEPLPEGEIKDSVVKLAKDCDFNLNELYKTDDSKRSSKQNAMMLGLFKHKVAIADTVLKDTTPGDVCAIIGHEIGHSKHLHIWKLIGLNQLMISIYLVSLNYIMNADSIMEAFGFVDEKPLVIGFGIMSLLVTPVTKILQLPYNMIIRHFEYQADTYAVERNLPLEHALIKLLKDNKTIIEPDALYSAFNHDHPTLAERIENMRKVQKKAN